MRRSRKIENLIKEITGYSYQVLVKQRLPDGYGAITDNENRVVSICQSQLDNWPLIWHEMGHIVCDVDDQTLAESEYNAQMWALQQLLKRKTT